MLMKRVLFLDKIYFRGKLLKKILLEQKSPTFLWMKLLIFMVLLIAKMGKRDGGGVMGEAVRCCCE